MKAIQGIFACLLIGLIALPLFADGKTDSLKERVRSELEDALKDFSNLDDVTPAVKVAPAAMPEFAPIEHGPLEFLTSKLTATHRTFLMEHVRLPGIKDDIHWLSDDLRLGRNAGYEGCDQSAEYLARRFKSIGLKAPFENDSYFQPFTFQMRGRKGVEGKTQNVVGVLPGSDPDRRDEVVVIGAHYDHVGTDGQANPGRQGRGGEDKIWNGADDNASGTGALIAVAEAIMASGYRPARTIVFIGFSAEEHGLFGSNYYVKNPLYPLDDTVAMINMDMIGRNEGQPMNVGAAGSSPIWNELIPAACEKTGQKVKLEEKFSPRSDHAPFIQNAIPAVFFFTGLHQDYHQPTDHPERLAWDQIHTIAKTAALVIMDIACLEERPEFTPVETDHGMQRGRMLGISYDPLTEDELKENNLTAEEGGIRVTNIRRSSAADEAGMHEGDILVKFAGTPIRTENSGFQLRKLLGDVEPNKKVEVEVIREGERKTLICVWGK
jgi:hypothetical protein